MKTHKTFHKIICGILIAITIVFTLCILAFHSFIFLFNFLSVALTSKLFGGFLDYVVLIVSTIFPIIATVSFILESNNISQLKKYKHHAIIGSISLIFTCFVLRVYFGLPYVQDVLGFRFGNLAFLFLVGLPLINMALCLGNNSDYSKLNQETNAAQVNGVNNDTNTTSADILNSNNDPIKTDNMNNH